MGAIRILVIRPDHDTTNISGFGRIRIVNIGVNEGFNFILQGFCALTNLTDFYLSFSLAFLDPVLS